MIALGNLKPMLGLIAVGVSVVIACILIVLIFFAGSRMATKTAENAGLWFEKARLERAVEKREAIEEENARLEAENEALARAVVAAGFAGGMGDDCVIADDGFMRQLGSISR